MVSCFLRKKGRVSLKFILCQNKSKLIPYSYPGVYTLNCSSINCSCNAEYIGETKKKVITRTIEHQQDSIKGKWESSGATEHCLECHGQFNWLHPKTLSRETRYKSRKIRESLEIIRSKCNSSLGSNVTGVSMKIFTSDLFFSVLQLFPNF